MSFFKKVRLTIDINPSRHVDEVVRMHKQFVDLCMEYKLDIAEVPGNTPRQITVVGSPRKIAAFQRDSRLLRATNAS